MAKAKPCRKTLSLVARCNSLLLELQKELNIKIDSLSKEVRRVAFIFSMALGIFQFLFVCFDLESCDLQHQSKEMKSL